MEEVFKNQGGRLGGCDINRLYSISSPRFNK